jgi:hypothetical protein
MNMTLKQLMTFLILVAPIAAVAQTDSCGVNIGSESGGAGPGKVCLAAPEIDPASAVSAFTLLAGCILTVRGRKSGK